jgi:hypothetical protein
LIDHAEVDARPIEHPGEKRERRHRPDETFRKFSDLEFHGGLTPSSSRNRKEIGEFKFDMGRVAL